MVDGERPTFGTNRKGGARAKAPAADGGLYKGRERQSKRPASEGRALQGKRQEKTPTRKSDVWGTRKEEDKTREILRCAQDDNIGKRNRWGATSK
ncbi:MAG: hypothetical protein NVS9B13_26360 [Candidatus Acidiferrum sp.]